MSSLKLPKGWEIVKATYRRDGVFARCSHTLRIIILTLPWWARPFRWWVLQHELGHAHGIEHDHGAPPFCIMHGSPNDDGWHEKGLLVWAKIAWAALKRRDWFCQQCRAKMILHKDG